MMDAPIKTDDVKCKVPDCIGPANDSGYCDQHDPYGAKIPTNVIGMILSVIGVIAVVIGVFVIIFSFTDGLSIIISGIILLGFGEIINLLQKIAHISYLQYRDRRKLKN